MSATYEYSISTLPCKVQLSAFLLLLSAASAENINCDAPPAFAALHLAVLRGHQASECVIAALLKSTTLNIGVAAFKRQGQVSTALYLVFVVLLVEAETISLLGLHCSASSWEELLMPCPQIQRHSLWVCQAQRPCKPQAHFLDDSIASAVSCSRKMKGG